MKKKTEVQVMVQKEVISYEYAHVELPHFFAIKGNRDSDIVFGKIYECDDAIEMILLDKSRFTNLSITKAEDINDICRFHPVFTDPKHAIKQTEYKRLLMEFFKKIK